MSGASINRFIICVIRRPRDLPQPRQLRVVTNLTSAHQLIKSNSQRHDASDARYPARRDIRLRDTDAKLFATTIATLKVDVAFNDQGLSHPGVSE